MDAKVTNPGMWGFPSDPVFSMAVFTA